MIPVGSYLLLSFALFAIGVLGAVLRRSAVAVLVSIALILNAVCINLAAFARLFGDASGQGFAFLVLVDALLQISIGAWMFRSLWRSRSAHRQAPSDSPEPSA